jgi:hypothetical protein
MKTLIAICVLLLTPALSNADEARYFPSLEVLHLPSVVADAKVYANARLQRDSDGSFVLRTIHSMTEAENAIYHRIHSAPCRPADVFNKLAAYKAYIDGNASLCLTTRQLITDEGGLVTYYLFVEKGAIQYVTDNSKDGYSVCCYDINLGYSKLEYGYLANGSFVSQALVDPLNYAREYVLRISGQAVTTLQF